MHVTVAMTAVGSGNGAYEADFLVDTGATDSLAPAAELRKIGVVPVGKTVYELADGRMWEYAFGLCRAYGRPEFGQVLIAMKPQFPNIRTYL